MKENQEVSMFFNHREENQKFILEKNGTIRCIDPKNYDQLKIKFESQIECEKGHFESQDLFY